MKHKTLNSRISKLQNYFMTDEDKIHGKSLLKSCQDTILKIISDISLKNESQYRELFYFEDYVENFRNLEKRFIFILLQIFQKDVINKNNEDLQIFISPKYNQVQKYINYNEKNYFFYTHLKVTIIFKNTLIHEFTTIFFWTNKLLLERYANFKTFNLIDFAIEKLSQINHSMFLKIKNPKKYHFFHYLQGVLENISSKFTLVTSKHDDYEDLFDDSQIFIEINYDDVMVFAIKSLHDKTIITQFNSATQSDFEKTFLISEMPKFAQFSREKINKIWQKTAKNLRTNFNNFWTKQDKLYVLVKTVNHLFSLEKNEIHDNDLSITTSQKTNIDFLQIYKTKNFDNKKQESLNFSWYFNTHNFKWEVANLPYETVKILIKNVEIAQKILNNLENFINYANIISSNRTYLQHKINSVVNATYYFFKTRYVYTKTKTICEISIDQLLVVNFTINWITKKSIGENLLQTIL